MQPTTFYLLLALLVAVTLLIIIYWLRQRVTSVTVKKNDEGFAMDLQASEPASITPPRATARPYSPTTTFSGNKQTGNKNDMAVSGPGQFTDNAQEGDENQMSLGSSPPPKK